MAADEHIEPLRILVANEQRDRHAPLTEMIAALGHEAIAQEVHVDEVAAVTAREHPDVALVALGLSSEHALERISEIVRDASCPVIALLAAEDTAYVREAAKRGVFADIVDTTPEELQRSTSRSASAGSVRAAGRDRAGQGDPDGAHGGRKLAHVAAAVTETHRLRPAETEPEPTSPVLGRKPPV